MLDLAVINGTVFIEGGFRKADVGIKDGKFAMIAELGCLPEAARVIDAECKYVLPGGIDTHVHYRDPGHAERETFKVGTRAAAAGGCTTFFEHPISIPPQYNAKILHNRVDLCKKGSCVDFCFFGAAGGEFPEEIEPLSHEGIVAYKTFLHEAPEGRDEEFKGLTSANNFQLMRALEETKKTGLTLAAHAEDNELVTGNIKRLRAEGRVDNLAHCESRPPIVEIEAIAKILRFSEEAGCPVELVHVSTCGAMELAKREKQKGRRILVETCPHYLLLDESYVEKYGAYAKCNPALRKKEEVEGLWNYITDGTIDFIGSDHSPYLVSEKEKGKDDIFTAPAGFPGIDLRMPLILTEAKKRPPHDGARGRAALRQPRKALQHLPAEGHDFRRSGCGPRHRRYEQREDLPRERQLFAGEGDYEGVRGLAARLHDRLHRSARPRRHGERRRRRERGGLGRVRKARAQKVKRGARV